jgi:hypothetical protein
MAIAAIFAILAAVCFFVGIFTAVPRFDLTSAGLFCLTVAVALAAHFPALR